MNPIRYIDDLLNTLTMYRVVLYGLLGLFLLALFFSMAGILSFSPLSLVLSLVVLLIACYGANTISAWALKVPVNVESVWITALILFFVVTPVQILSDVLVVGAVGVLSMTTKYLLAWNKKHVFNPAAIALVIAGLFGLPIASWWVANPVLAPFTLLVGLLVVRKIRRFEMFFTFLVAASVGIFGLGISRGADPLDLLFELYASWPIAYFATFMLTEPLTTPPTRQLRLVYAVLVGALFGSQFHVWRLYATPELALVIGNIFAYLVSPKYRLMLFLKKRTKIATDTYDFAFASSQKMEFSPGQYMEWTLPHAHPDTRGNRRYFTLASSPTESEIHLGVRISQPSSSFKKELMAMKPGAEIVAGQLAGDFTLPTDTEKPLVFIAGGIGITPFRSMIQYLVDSKQQRKVTLFYVNRREEDIAYQEVFERAKKKLDLEVIYVLTDTQQIPPNWSGEVGYINAEMVQKYIFHCLGCMYYLSGPNKMVEAYQDLLKEMGVKSSDIVTDYFPGF